MYVLFLVTYPFQYLLSGFKINVIKRGIFHTVWFPTYSYTTRIILITFDKNVYYMVCNEA